MNGDLIPVTDEQAKAITEALKLSGSLVDVVKSFGKYAVNVLGDLPRDLMGIVGDKVHVYRQRKMAEMLALVPPILEERGVEEPLQPAPKILIPLLQAAGDENSEEMQKLWANMLASAMDPARAGSIRSSYIELLRQMDPLDALVLQKARIGYADMPSNIFGAQHIAEKLDRRQDQIEISLDNLGRLGLVENPRGTPRPTATALGRELLAAVD